ncbi:NAD-dependent epimerase/dehydratase family protein [Halorientalis marina]|uniref:NAD-dependent epimerase/dehydratase family protein n=1 Tax=Halorientalis marina TaxID=2931976 RepID=UPI001FF6704A|nr:NAD-dependent epimerase/dehydratase family protein [Halorientalis marina]
MAKRVFITGVAGFLGSHLADRFLERGHEVVGNDTFRSGYADNLPSEVEFHEIDCLDLDEMKTAMDGADIVYHTAALAHEGLSVFSPLEINRSIYEATTATLAAAADTGIERFIYCSSMSRYGENKTPFREDMEPDPQDPYGISKVAGERLTTLMGDVHDFDTVIAVPHNIYGPRQRYDDPFRNVIAIFINRMLQGEQPIIYGDGTQKRCFTYIDDAVRPLSKLAFNENVVGEAVNIGPDKEFVSINTLAETIASDIGFDLDPIYVEERPQEVELANCSADKARQLLDYQTEYTLRQGVAEMVEWIDERGPKEFEYHIDLEINNGNTPETWQNELI